MTKPCPAVRVLVVDDDPRTAETITRAFAAEDVGVTPWTAPDGLEAEVRDGGHHAVVLSVRGPLDRAEALAARLHRVDSDVALLVLTDDARAAFAEPPGPVIASYLLAPLDPARLRAVLDGVAHARGLRPEADEPLQRRIGEQIRALRKARDLTLKQVARRTGLSVSLLSQIERAESSASIGSLHRIAVALQTKVGALFDDR